MKSILISILIIPNESDFKYYTLIYISQSGRVIKERSKEHKNFILTHY